MTNTRKTLIALATAAALTVGFGASAQANSNVNIDFGINLGGAGLFDSGYGGYGGYYDAGFGDDGDCGYKMMKTKHWNWNHTHKIISWSKQWVCY